jgi:hypothetical protein
MLEAGGGGGGGGTYWYGIDPDTMWAWVNRDLSAHYEHANAWKKASELTGLYQSRLQTFRDKLAQSWNPQTSPAAEAYLTRLDELIKAVKDVDEVAGRNYQAAVDIPNAIYEAKTKLEPIYNRFKQAERDYDAEDASARSTADDSPANRYNDTWIEAAGVMYTLSGDLSQSQSALGKPMPYEPPRSRQGNTDETRQSDGTVSPPVIPPVVPIVPAAVPSAIPSGPVSPVAMPKAPDLQGLNPTLPSGTPPIGTPPSSGPVTPPTGPGIPAPLPPRGPIGKPAPAGIPPKGGYPPIPGAPPTGPAVARPTGMPGVIGGNPGAGRPAGGVRANPVGGMIGGPASGRGAGGAVPGGVGRGPGATGGVIGGSRGPAGRGPGQGGTGAAGRSVGAGVMGAGGRGAGRQDEDGEHFDPDTTWDVAQGVAPVLDVPEAQGPIDPGPAIGLSR